VPSSANAVDAFCLVPSNTGVDGLAIADLDIDPKAGEET
jgi:hypothetical protein